MIRWEVHFLEYQVSPHVVPLPLLDLSLLRGVINATSSGDACLELIERPSLVIEFRFKGLTRSEDPPKLGLIDECVVEVADGVGSVRAECGCSPRRSTTLLSDAFDLAAGHLEYRFRPPLLDEFLVPQYFKKRLHHIGCGLRVE